MVGVGTRLYIAQRRSLWGARAVCLTPEPHRLLRERLLALLLQAQLHVNLGEGGWGWGGGWGG